MNQIVQDQVRNGQSSAAAPTGPIGPSEAARIMAQRRTELRQEAATKAPADPIQDPPEDAADEQSLSGNSDEADGQQVNLDADDAQDGESQVDQPDADADEGEYVIELDGETVPLSQIKSWREGAMRQEDYSRKTQAVAQQASVMNALEQRVNGFAHAMNRHFMDTQQEMSKKLTRYQELDWVKLAQADPAKYTAAKAAFDAEQGRFQAQQNQWNGFLQEFDKLSQETLQMRAQAALPEIKQRVTGWNDGMYAQTSEFLVKRYGFDTAMVGKITDPQFWEMARDAYVFNKGRNVQTKQKVVRSNPKVQLRSTAGVTQRMQTSANQQKLHESVSTLTGRSQMEAAADLMRQRRESRGKPQR